MSSLLWKNIFRGQSDEISLTTHLKSNVLFQDLSRKELRFVSDIVHLRNYRDGECVFRQDDLGVGMYIIVSGAVAISAHQPHTETNHPHDTIVIAQLESGDFFGELALVEENGRRSATAVAVGATTLIGFFKPDLFDIIKRNPQAGLKISLRLGQVLGQRLKKTTARVIELKSHPNGIN